jgi:hypothetical protein
MWLSDRNTFQNLRPGAHPQHSKKQNRIIQSNYKKPAFNRLHLGNFGALPFTFPSPSGNQKVSRSFYPRVLRL